MAVQGISSVANPQSGLVIESIGASVQYSDDSLVLSSIARSEEDLVSLNRGVLKKSLTVTAEEILYKLNQLLKDDLPAGVESLSVEETTPEATAQRVVDGIALLFETFKKQNTKLNAEELIEQFMAQARKGVEQGYGDAFAILDGLGAFQYEGVQQGVEKTKSLIEEKLRAFEAKKRSELGTPASVEIATSAATSTQLMTQAAGSLSVVA